MRLTLGRDWKLRNERGEVVGSVTPGFELVIDTRIDGGAAGVPSVSEKGETDSSSQPATSSRGEPDVGPTEQATLALQLPVVARAREAAKFDPESEVWKFYVELMKPRNKGLDSQARQVIKDALKVATIQECKDAITACHGSDYHMNRPGAGNDRRKYNAISQILRGKRGKCTTRERVDFFLEMGEKAGLQSGVPSGDPGRINAAKQDVRDAHEMPGDEHVAKRGRESQAWLERLGWTIERDQTGWPSFRPPSAGSPG